MPEKSQLHFDNEGTQTIEVNQDNREITVHQPEGPQMTQSILPGSNLENWESYYTQNTNPSSLNYDATTSIGHFMIEKAITDPVYRKLPASVEETFYFLQEHNLPVKIIPNLAPTLEGCEGAHEVRDRLIPAQENPFLPDELKTILIKFKKSKTEYNYVPIHFRGNLKMSNERIRQILVDEYGISNKKAKGFRFVPEEELESEFGLKKGLVTPFIRSPKITTQIFDVSCTESYGMPFTTNAAHPEWSTQFDGNELIDALSKFQKIIITEATETGISPVLELVSNFRKATLGILEYGFEATNLFRRLLKQKIDHKLENLKESDLEGNPTIPFERAGSFTELATELIGCSSELEEVMDSTDSCREAIHSRLNQVLKRLGNTCTKIALPCNILPRFIDRALRRENKIISIEKAVTNDMYEINASEPDSKFLFLGGASVANTAKSIYRPNFNSTLEKNTNFLKLPESRKVEKAMLQINNNNFSSATQNLFEVLKETPPNQKIIIASTSISILYHQNGKQLLNPAYLDPEDQATAEAINSRVCIDTLESYANLCAEELLPTQN